MFDINQLESFLAVTAHRSFSVAAEALYITQPAISKRIASLEHMLDCQLFDRMGRQVHLTQAGSLLLPRARAIVEQWVDTQRELSNLSGTVSGSLAIGTSHHIGLHRLPPILREYTKRFQSVSLDLRLTDSETAYEEVLQGVLEVAVVTLPPQHPPQLYSETIWQDPLAFVVGKEHSLANRKSVPLTELVNHQAILPSLATFTRRIVEALFEGSLHKIDVAIETNYLETNRMLVSIGLGWSVLPASMINDDITAITVVTHLNERGHQKPITLSRELGCVHHVKRVLSNAAQAFLSIVRAQSAIHPACIKEN